MTNRCRIDYRPLVKRDIENTFHYLSKQSPQTAMRFIESLERTVELLRSFPMLGRIVESDLRLIQLKGFRSQLLLYRSKEDLIVVVRILHAAQDYEQLLKGENDADD